MAAAPSSIKNNHETILYSWNPKNFNKRHRYVAEALGDLPANTSIDGEVMALDDSGRPNFHALQHFQASANDHGWPELISLAVDKLLGTDTTVETENQSFPARITYLN